MRALQPALYSDSIVSRTLDYLTLKDNFLSKACGDTLELGIGTSLNPSHYPKLISNGDKKTQ